MTRRLRLGVLSAALVILCSFTAGRIGATSLAHCTIRTRSEVVTVHRVPELVRDAERTCAGRVVWHREAMTPEGGAR